MTELQFELSNEVSLKRVRIVLTCKTCQNEWACYLTSLWRLPLGGDVCGKCQQKETKVNHDNGQTS